MIVVFVIKENPLTVYVTTPDYFSKFLQDMKIGQGDVVWTTVSLESLMLLGKGTSSYLVLR